jgi:hypothetical protein
VVLRAAFPARLPNAARDGDAAMQPRLIPNKGPEPVDVHVPGLGDEAAMSIEAVRSPPPITRASLRLYSHQLLKRLSRSSALPAKLTASFANWHRIAALSRTNQVARGEIWWECRLCHPIRRFDPAVLNAGFAPIPAVRRMTIVGSSRTQRDIGRAGSERQLP